MNWDGKNVQLISDDDNGLVTFRDISADCLDNAW